MSTVSANSHSEQNRMVSGKIELTAILQPAETFVSALKLFKNSTVNVAVSFL